MTIACEKKDKPSGQTEPILNTDLTSSAEPIVRSAESGVSREKHSPVKDSASCSKGRTVRQQGARRDSYNPATSYCNYYYPGYGGAYGSWGGRSFRAADGSSMPSGLMKYYGPAGVYPPARYPKQGPIQNGGPAPHRPKPVIWNGNSRLNPRDRPIRKDDYQGLIQSGGPAPHRPKPVIWNGNPRPNPRDGPIRKDDYQVSDELTRGPRVITKNDHVDSVSEPSGVAILGDKYNLADFPTEYEHAKFYVIKSYSEDDVHKCIKYDVWSSTLMGNKRLDAAFHDAEVKASEFGKCPLFLFFSVNGSGQFVGVAEMIGKVDFNKTMDFWLLDKWSGFFPVRWHIIKDIPNSQLRHILLDSNDNRPVTYTRDTQEIGLKEGLEMLKIFKGYSAKSSLLNDFEFYENREKTLHARKSSKSAAYQAEEHTEEFTDHLDIDGEGVVKTTTFSSPVSGLVDLTKNLYVN